VDKSRGAFIFSPELFSIFFNSDEIFGTTKLGLAVYQFFRKPYRNPFWRHIISP
jgi:hypothetical protein